MQLVNVSRRFAVIGTCIAAAAVVQTLFWMTAQQTMSRVISPIMDQSMPLGSEDYFGTSLLLSIVCSVLVVGIIALGGLRSAPRRRSLLFLAFLTGGMVATATFVPYSVLATAFPYHDDLDLRFALFRNSLFPFQSIGVAILLGVATMVAAGRLTRSGAFFRRR